jgi:hypothetical protein
VVVSDDEKQPTRSSSYFFENENPFSKFSYKRRKVFFNRIREKRKVEKFHSFPSLVYQQQRDFVDEKLFRVQREHLLIIIAWKFSLMLENLSFDA